MCIRDSGKAKEKLLEVAAKRNPDLDDSEIAEDQTIIDAVSYTHLNILIKLKLTIILIKKGCKYNILLF